MKLKKISLRNYRQHHELDVEFNGNLIAVVGKNGSGKSNFLGAIQFALTGEQPGFTKDDLLSWGAEAGSVELAFEHNGRECLVQRRIEKPAATLTIDGEKFTGTKKVQEALDELLGIDKDVFRQSVFVRQTEIESCLFEAPAVREANFQKLVGLGDAAKHNKFLVDFLAAADRPKDMSDEIARYSELIGTQRSSIASLAETAASIDAKIALFPEEDISARIADLNSKAAMARDAFDKHADMVSANEALAKFRETHPDAEKMHKVDTSALHNKISEINLYRSECRTRAMQAETLRQARDEVARLETQMKSFDGLDAKVEEANSLKEAISAKRAERDQLEDLVSKAPSGNSCPLCGSTVDHDIRGELSRRILEIATTIGGLTTRLQSLGNVDSLVRDRNRVAASLEARNTAIQSMGVVVAPPVGWDADTTAELNRLNAEVMKADVDNAKSENERAELNMLRMSVDRATQAYDNAINKIPGNPNPEMLGRVAENIGKAVSDLLARQQELSTLKAEKARMDGMVQQAMEAVRQSEEALEKLKATQQANKLAEEKLKVISDVKDWFNYRNGPRVMSQAVMGMLTEETNRYLTKFGSLFTVIPMEEGMGFRCVFNDGRDMPNPPPEATMLSGGQKIQLAVAFRFAVYSMFAGKLGLLSLDEPTAYLDDEAISKFGDMLGSIRDMARNMDLQVYMATHETSILGTFDQVITIGG